MKREGFYAHWPHAGFPTQSTGPYETAEQAWAAIDEYDGPDKIKVAAYVLKYKMVSNAVPRPAPKTDASHA